MANKRLEHPATGVPLALGRVQARGRRPLRVGSPTISGGIPLRHSEYDAGVSPEISWTGLAEAKSYALILEDPDAKTVRPFVHWLAWNIPGSTTRLPEGIEEGVLQGKTSRGSVGYFGPRPPPGDPPHHYHFQVFALDTELDVPAGAERDEVLEAMSGHVLAAGELVGTFQQDATPPK